jgi:hypothetical protein
MAVWYNSGGLEPMYFALPAGRVIISRKTLPHYEDRASNESSGHHFGGCAGRTSPVANQAPA